ncbi:hypothetical protein J2Z21_004206 [Streptomyces griseochromogenes]|uniref:DUF4034 domain-containing protein n=1 Tax=Streptomyces griseochromogenes TaxID=68214 RepID=A0A1B1AVD7_9ACTN|nr:hypothetical protein [Streptomyces griseochromogenes]ANP50482.1 hypothetical protein AVL59_13400 [Streptomyces griseochromogenes]MBP2051235.1 hypothetical protein [Streptomyces griseochromogenes]
MPFIGRRRSPAPRLSPELDDVALGNARRRLTGPSSPARLDLAVALVEDLVNDAGDDWDRRTHRLDVLAEAAGQGLLHAWRRRRPQSQDALVLHAWSDLVHARRDGSATRLPAAVDTCHRAADLRSADPAPWVVLLGILRLQGRPAAELRPLWWEVKDRDPWNREAHLQLLGYLSPDECGSSAKTTDFIEEVRATAPVGSPVSGLELAAFVDRYQRAVSKGGIEALSANFFWTQRQAAQALDHAVARWSQPGFLCHAAALADLNMLAYALIRADRLTEAADVLRALGGVATARPWGWDGDPLERFSHWHTRLLG